MTGFPLTIERHTLALISIVGCSLDVLGALYLAYDVLGGEHGPLRTLTRAVTYGLLFGIGYGLPLGPVFGVACGVTYGITLAWEYARASRHEPNPGFWHDLITSAIRALAFGVGAAWHYGAVFGVMFGVLNTAGQLAAYRVGIRPSMDYQPMARVRFSRAQFLAVLNRTAGYTAAGYVSALVAHERDIAMGVGIYLGLVVGVVTAVVSVCTSFIEWGADHVPEKRMGVFGVGLILVGFGMQSVQYWVALLDVPVHG
jgi:hypothetical protein